jgi:hypothetical protein
MLAGTVPAGAQVPRLRLHNDVVVSVRRMARMVLVRGARITRMLSTAGGCANKRSAKYDREDDETPHRSTSSPWLPQFHRSGAQQALHFRELDFLRQRAVNPVQRAAQKGQSQRL